MLEINEGLLKRKQQQHILHILRNPWGWASEDVVREVRLMADELERLYQVEQAARQAADDFHAATK